MTATTTGLAGQQQVRSAVLIAFQLMTAALAPGHWRSAASL